MWLFYNSGNVAINARHTFTIPANAPSVIAVTFEWYTIGTVNKCSYLLIYCCEEICTSLDLVVKQVSLHYLKSNTVVSCAIK